MWRLRLRRSPCSARTPHSDGRCPPSPRPSAASKRFLILLVGRRGLGTSGVHEAYAARVWPQPGDVGGNDDDRSGRRPPAKTSDGDDDGLRARSPLLGMGCCLRRAICRSNHTGPQGGSADCQGGQCYPVTARAGGSGPCPRAARLAQMEIVGCWPPGLCSWPSASTTTCRDARAASMRKRWAASARSPMPPPKKR